MQVQISQVHWSGLKGSERSTAVMGELRVVASERAEERERGGAAAEEEEALRLWECELEECVDSW